jgi:hypothetical protein
MPDTDPRVSDTVAVLKAAREIANEIRAGALGLYEGCRRVWWECQLYLPDGDHTLDAFTYWASEYEEAENAERKMLCERGMHAAVDELMGGQSAL